MRKLIFHLLFFVLVLAACEKEEEINNTFQPQVICPLENGNQWDYNQTAPGQTGQLTLTVPRDTVIGTEKWYRFGFSIFPWVTNRSGGFYGYQNDIVHLLFKYPSAASNSFWNGTDSVNVLSVDTLITTPAGTYRCYLYEWRLSQLSPLIVRKEFLAPDIGWVKMEEYDNFNLTSRWELLSYTLN